MYKKIIFLLIFCVTNLQSMFYTKHFLNKKTPQKCFKFKNTKRFSTHKNNPIDKMSQKDMQELCGYTPLHLVFVSNQYQDLASRKKVATLLLKSGANPNIQDIFGHTPLHWAMRFNDPDLIMLLIEHGADLDIQNFRGEKPSDIPLRRLYYDDLFAD